MTINEPPAPGTAAVAKADWYPDPENPSAQLRYWDGSAWTEHRSPVGGASAAEPSPYRNLSPRRITGTGGRSMPLTIVGGLLILGGAFGTAAGGLGGMGVLQPAVAMSVAVTLSIQFIAIAAAYVVFARFRFPHRSKAALALAIILAVAYVLLVPATSAFIISRDPSLVGLVGFLGIIAGIGGIVFGVIVALNRMLPVGFRVAPLLMTALIFIGNQIGASASGIAVLGIGIAYVVLAARTGPEIEAASVATAQQRAGREPLSPR